MNKTFEHKFDLETMVATNTGRVGKISEIKYTYNGVFNFVSYRIDEEDYRLYCEEDLKPYNPIKDEFEIVEEGIIHIGGTTKGTVKVKRNGIEYNYEREEFNKMFK